MPACAGMTNQMTIVLQRDQVRSWPLCLAGAVSRIARKTGSTQSATIAIITPGAIAAPVLSMSRWAR